MSLRRIRIPMRVRDAAYSEAERRAAAFYRGRRADSYYEQRFNLAYERCLLEWREADGRPAWLRGAPRPPRP